MDIWKKRLLRRMQHAQGYAQITNELDRGIMLGMPASLKGSLHGKPAIARAMFIAGLAIALLPLQTIKTNRFIFIFLLNITSSTRSNQIIQRIFAALDLCNPMIHFISCVTTVSTRISITS